MRKIDKKNNFKKVNLLVEQRYLDSKGINESFNNPISEEAPIDRMYGSNEWVDAQQNAGKDIDSIKGEYTSQLYAMEKPYYNNNEALQMIIGIYQSHIQQLSSMMRNNTDSFNPVAGDDSELNEDGLGDYTSELRDTGGYPWSTFLGDKDKGSDEKFRNQQASGKFKDEFNNAFKGQSINTTNGRYFFDTLKFKNNFGSYDLIFTKPKGDTEFSDKMLWVKYDQSNGYYIDSNDDVELIDKGSVDKVIDMLQYNK